jgi:2-polyprenyl-3-methyl-5-hydroxy-6-metoxy-1,4-benzoquinol methylase
LAQPKNGLDEATVAQRKQAIIDQHGPWFCNIHLVGNVFTKEPDEIGVIDERIHRVVQLVADHAGKPFKDLRILDLGAFEGAFAIELARHGAKVVMIEARKPHVAKARFVKEVLSLNNLDVVQDDVRSLSSSYGSFDVVLCLGLLYHLDAPDLIPFLTAVHEVCEHLVILETQMSLTARAQIQGPGGVYSGRYFGENVHQFGAAIDNSRALWLTKASLLNLLQDVGFTSVSQCLNPPIGMVDAFVDHGTFVAVKGERQPSLTSSPISQKAWENSRWSEQMKKMSEPRQRVVWRIRERLSRVFGKSIYGKLFRPNRPGS